MCPKTPVISGIESVELAEGDTMLCPETGSTILAQGAEIDAIPPSSKRIALSSFGSAYAEFLFERFAA